MKCDKNAASRRRVQTIRDAIRYSPRGTAVHREFGVDPHGKTAAISLAMWVWQPVW